jgi:acyl-CoA synthetase (AMP-forming)/AMP-acid ligase II/3-hydroxymyristoyl/3-hydroxydecanoyl-(acyl carrier protein) dehydratase|tara:strand:+ start:99 stop:1823 length:1725 start_codon:yes stop_codon:yes gene_type:complete
MTSEIVPLDKIGYLRFPDDHIVCNYPERDYGELLLVSAQIRQKVISYSSRRVLIVTEDSFYFVAVLFACWSVKCIPVIAPDTLSHTIEQLEDVVACIVSNSFSEYSGKLNRLWKDSTVQKPLKPFSLDPNTTAFELFTSGSTGKRKSIPKTFRQISNELIVLEKLWGEKVDGKISLGTVSHQHIYGLLFRVLWPFCRGTPLTSQASFYWEELLSRADENLCFIVSSPTHLNHLPSFKDYLSKNKEENPIVLFSSGGLLNREASINILESFGSSPIEVYGSTETGGIAHRQQTSEKDRLWNFFPNVLYRTVGGVLQVQSPLLLNEKQWQVTGDLVTIAENGQFRLHGRSDRMIKLGEKRVSLDLMESLLLQHRHINQAAVVSFLQAGRLILGAVIEVNNDACEELKTNGKESLLDDIKFHLKSEFESGALPRKWRFLRQLPIDAQGKRNHLKLTEIFQPRPKTARIPVIIETIPITGGERYLIEIPNDYAMCEGHFNNFKVVPGVCQLDWIEMIIREISGKNIRIYDLPKIKFYRFIRPGQSITIDISFNENKNNWLFNIYNRTEKFTSGRVMVN